MSLDSPILVELYHIWDSPILQFLDPANGSPAEALMTSGFFFPDCLNLPGSRGVVSETSVAGHRSGMIRRFDSSATSGSNWAITSERQPVGSYLGHCCSGGEMRPSPIERTFLKYEQAIRRVIRRITGTSDAVDDLAQEAFLRAIIAEAKRPIDNAKAYLFASARNIALNERTRKSRAIIQSIESTVVPTPDDGAPSTEEVIIGRERYAMFCEAVLQLPPQCRKVFLMCKVYGRSHKEIAKAMGVSVSTIEKHVATGLARCAAHIKQCEQGTPKPVLRQTAEFRRSQ